MRALVLSGGGLFGAWQAGAWSALDGRFQPDLIVGASVGSLNGYAIACGATPEMLREMWLNSRLSDFSKLDLYLQEMTEQHRPRIDLAVVITDLFRVKPRIVRGAEVTWRHLSASCAVPLYMKQVWLPRPSPEECVARPPGTAMRQHADRRDTRATWWARLSRGDRLYSDGGLLNPLPIYAAVALGATEIVALHALPEIPSVWLKPFALAFRAVFGVNPPLPDGVSTRILLPSQRLGGMRDALRWKRENIEGWLELGRQDVQKTFPL